MIRRDEFGCIVDTKTGDGGDSANRSGLYTLFDREFDFGCACFSCVAMLDPKRHPKQVPWNNPKNFSRDQLIPLLAGLSRLNLGRIHARYIFWRCARNFFFAPNSERDYPGSTKYPWPHKFHSKLENRDEFRWFDFADPLFPDVVWHLILCARLRFLYWYAIIGAPWLAFAIVWHGYFDRSDDEGQIISQAVVAGPWFVRLYKRVTPDWQARLDRYWGGWRDMQEMADLIKSRL